MSLCWHGHEHGHWVLLLFFHLSTLLAITWQKCIPDGNKCTQLLAASLTALARFNPIPNLTGYYWLDSFQMCMGYSTCGEMLFLSCVSGAQKVQVYNEFAYSFLKIACWISVTALYGTVFQANYCYLLWVLPQYLKSIIMLISLVLNGFLFLKAWPFLSPSWWP